MSEGKRLFCFCAKKDEYSAESEEEAGGAEGLAPVTLPVAAGITVGEEKKKHQFYAQAINLMVKL